MTAATVGGAIQCVFSFLDAKALGRAESVCRFWRTESINSWKQRCLAPRNPDDLSGSMEALSLRRSRFTDMDGVIAKVFAKLSDEYLKSGFHAAAGRGRNSAVREWMQHPRFAEIDGECFSRAFQYAVYHNRVDTALVFTASERFAEIDGRTDNLTMLHAAARGQASLVQALVNRHPFLSVHEALSKSIEGRHVAVAQILIDHDRVVPIDRYWLGEVFGKAAEKDLADIVRSLRSCRHFAEVSERLVCAALYQAAEPGNISVVQELLGWDGSIQIPLYSLESALFVAVRNQHADVVSAIMGTIISRPHPSLYEILETVFYEDRFLVASVMQTFVNSENFARVSVNQLKVLFCWAASIGSAWAVQILLDCARAVEIDAKMLGEALVMAVERGRAHVVPILLNCDASAEIDARVIRKALYRADCMGHVSIAAALRGRLSRLQRLGYLCGCW